jgi:predicted nucleic-acid-binding Zn-ribbon protein
LIFAYTVKPAGTNPANNDTNDVDQMQYGAITLAGGATIKDYYGNSARLDLPSLETTNAYVVTQAAKPTFTLLDNTQTPLGASANPRATPVSTVVLDFQVTAAGVGLGFAAGATVPIVFETQNDTRTGYFGLGDLELTKDGIVVPITGVALIPSVESDQGFSRYQISNFSGLTNTPGTYILTFADYQIGTESSTTWIVTEATPAQLTVADIKLAPTETTTPRQTVVDSATITFSQNVFGVDLTDFTLTRDGGLDQLAGAAGVQLSGSGKTYVLSGLSAITATEGSYRLAVSNTNATAIQTFAGGRLIAPAAAVWDYDLKPLIVANGVTFAGVNGTKKVGETLEFNATFNEKVTVTGVPALKLIIGTTKQTATYVSGSGTTALKFQYTVASGDEDLDGITFETNAVSLPAVADTIVDATGNSARLEFTPPGLTGVLVDGVAPTVTLLANPTAVPINPGTTALTFTLSETSANFAAGDVTVTGGTLSPLVAVDGKTYTATLTPNVGFTGDVVLTIAANSFTDTAGNPNAPTNLTVGVAPTATLVASPTSVGIGQTSTVTVTLSKPSATFALGDIAVAGGTLGGFVAVSPTVYTAVFTPAVNSTTAGTVSVPAGVFTDAAGNNNTGSTTNATITVDTVAPTLVITSSVNTVQSGSTATITFTLSEAATNFTLSDITATNGTLSNFAATTPVLGVPVAGTVYTVDFTPNASFSGAANIAVAAGAFSDAAGNVSTAAGSLALAVNTVAPTVTITSSAATLGSTQTALITVTLSAASTNFVLNDITATGGTLSNFAGTGSSYTAIFTPNASGSATLSVAAGAFTDSAGNQNLAGALVTPITVDITAPTATLVASPTSVGIGQTSTVTITLSKPSATFALGDIAVAGGTLGGFVAVSPTVYTAVFTPAVNSTTAGTVSVPAGVFTDAAGNNNTASSATNITVDTVAPQTVGTIAGPAAGSYKTNDKLSFTVPFNDSVTVTGMPTLAFAIGSITRQASYTAGSSTTTLTFEYTIVADDAANSVALGANAISISGSSIKDSAGNNATLVTAANTFNGVAVNRLAPTVTVTAPTITPPAIAAFLKTGDVIELTATFSQSATVSGLPSIALTIGSRSVQAIYAAGSGTTAVRFRYTIQTGDFDADGVDLPASIIALNGGTISDPNGNAVSLAFAPPVTSGIQVFATIPTAPTVNSLLTNSLTPTLTGTATLTAGQTLTVVVGGATYNNVVPVAGNWSLNLATATPASGTLVLAAGTSNVVATIADTAGNSASDTTTGELVIDTAVPTVLSVNSSTPDGAYKVGQAILIQVQLDKTVTVIGFPTLALNTTPVRSATFGNAAPNALGTVLTFTYTVQSGDTAADLNATALVLNGGSIKDALGNSLSLTLPGTTLASIKDLVIDTTAPSAPTVTTQTTNVTPPTIAGTATLNAGETLSVVINGATYNNVPVVSNVWSLNLATTAASSGTLGGFTNGTSYNVVATVTDAAGNATGDSTTNEIQIFTTIPTAPTVNSLLTNSLTPTLTGTATLAAGQKLSVVVGGATYNNVAVLGGAWSLNLAAATPSSGTLVLAAGTSNVTATIADTAGNSASDTTTGELVIDTAVPTVLSVNSSTPDGSYKAGQTILIQVQLDKTVTAVTTLGSPTLTLNAGRSATFVSAVGNVLNFTYTVQSGDTAADLNATALNLNNATVKDTAGNSLSLTLPVSQAAGSLDANKAIVIDTTAPAVPTVTIATTNVTPPTIAGSATLNAGETLSVVINGATYNNVPVIGGNWTLNLATIAPSVGTLGGFTNGRYSITATVTDAAGNASGDTTTNELNIISADITQVVASADGRYKLGDVIDFDVTFLKAATVAGKPQLAFSIGGTTVQAVYVNGSGTPTLKFRYTVGATDVDPNGIDMTSSTITLPAGASIVDNAGTALSLSFVPPVTTGIIVDGQVPTVLPSGVILPYAGSYKLGSVLTFTFPMSENVIVTGNPTLPITIGTNVRTGTFVAPASSPSKTMTFQYTVVDTDIGPISISLGSLMLGTATVRDIAGNDANLTYTAGSTAGILVDGAKPIVLSIAAQGNGTFTTGNVITIQATFSEAVVVQGLPPTLRLNSVPNTATRYATYATGSGSNTLLFRYVVQDGDSSPDLDYFDNASLIVAAGSSVRDTAGNDADLALAVPGAVNSIGFLNDVVIDTLPPSVVSFTSNTINGSYKAGQQVRINATLSEPIATGRTFDVTLDTGAIVTLATNGTTTASGVYTIANGQNSSDLTVVDLAGGTLLDSALNPLVLSLPAAPNNLADSKNIIVDTVAPTVALASDKAALKSGETAIITFTLSESSTNFIASDVTATGGTLSGFAGTGSVYTAIFTPTASSMTPGQVSVAANTFTDTAANGNQAATLPSVIAIDTIVPTIAISSSKAALKAGDTATITFTLSENSTAFVDDDVTVSGGTLSSLSGSGSVYTAVFTPTASSTTSGQVSVAANKFTDAAGNGNLASILLTLPTDTVVPTVAITSDKSALGVGQTATITFTLSENSTNFTETGVTVSGGTLSGFGGTGSVYTAIFTPTVNSTTPGSVFVGANAFTDAASNGNTAALLSPALVIDTIVPTVTVTSSVLALKAGQTATIFFTLSDSTNQFTDSDITVVGGTLSSLSGSGTSYSAVFTPTVNSTTPGQISVAANAFTDTTGNGNIAGSVTIQIDTIAPTLFIATSKPALKIGDTATISFALSEASTNFTAASVTVTGGSLTNLLGSGTAYTATFTPAVNSTVAGTITVAANSFTDAAGNGNTAFSLPTPIAIDTLAPTIAIASSKSALKIGDTATITFTLSEPSVTFGLASLAVAGGSFSSFAGTGASYSAIFTPNANSTTPGSITIANNAFFDAAGNGNIAGALSPTITIDTVAPTVTVTSSKAALKIGDTATITFTLSEPSSDFTQSDVTVAGGTLSGFAGAGTSYTAMFTPTASSTAAGSISVPAASFTDGVGNGNIAGALATPISIDTIAPTVAITASKAALKSGETAIVSFTLSETSTTFTSSDVTVTGGTLSGFAGSGTVYSATFTPTANSTAPGAISVTTNNFTDAAGNGNVTGTLTPSITVDTVAPTVSISSNKAALKSGDTATITFTLSEAATDFTAGDVAVTGGAISGFTGSGTSYTATFTPTANSTSAGTVSVAATTFTDPAGNANVASQLTPSLSIDTVAPTVAISSNTTALRIGETATITFTLSEPSTTFALGDVAATGGTLSNFTGSGASYTATFTPAATSNASGTISIAANAFTDMAGNGNVAGSLAIPIAIDTIAPTAVISSNKSSLKIGDTATITFTLSDSTNQFTASDITAVGGTLSGFTGSGTSYSAVFTPTQNSMVASSISVLAGAFNDAAGNANNTSALTPSITIDTVAPTIAISSNKAALKSGDTATITLTLSEPSTTFAAADVTAVGGTLSGFTGSGASYTATFTPTASSTTPGSISVAAGTFTDAAGNGNIAGQLSPTLTVDTVAPTISIVSNASALRSGETATITFTLSEPSTDFTIADVAAVGGTISGLTGSGTSYTATFSPNAGSTTPGSVSVAAATFTDPAGNANVAGSLATPITIDTVAPTISITSNKSALKSGETATITFTLSESATDFTAAGVAAVGGTISGFTGSGTTYSATFTPAASSTASGSVSVAAAKFSDAAGNANIAGSLTPTITIDTVAPTVTITSNKAALKSGDSATITFTLSESSTTFAAADVAATGGTISGFAGSGTSYTATFTPDATSTTPGSVSVAAGTFTDSAGNGNVAGSLATPISIDTAAPVVTGFSTSTDAGVYGTGRTIAITATISEAVRAGSSLVATLNTGATVTLSTANAGTTLSGTYTVSAGENVDQLSVVSYTAGSTVDAAGNGLAVLPVAGGMVARANINLGSPLSASNLATPIAIDTTAPTVVNFTSPLANGTYATAAVIPITATLSETVQAGGTISVTLNTGAVVTLVALTQGTVLTGNYIVRPGDVTFDLDVISYQVTGGAVVDLAGNATTNTALPDVAGRLATLKNIAIDASIKVSSGVGFSTNPNVIPDKRGAVTAVPITFTTPVSGVRLSAIRVYFNGRSISLRGASITGSGANYLLRLPARSTTPKGFYTVQVLPTAGIRAISTGAAMTETAQVYWGNGRSLGVKPTARAKAFGRI